MNNLFIVDEELFDIRIDRYLSELLPDVSRSFIQKLLKDNEILLNDKPVRLFIRFSQAIKLILIYLNRLRLILLRKTYHWTLFMKMMIF